MGRSMNPLFWFRKSASLPPVPPAVPARGQEAVHPGWDSAAVQMLRGEFQHMKAWTQQTGHTPPDLEQPARQPGNLTGLAFSGGGIRSATFCLGAAQAMARAGLLKKFDYLSTVSGGGYIGSSITWWVNKEKGFGLGADFPYGTDDPSRPAGVAKGADPSQDNPRQRQVLDFLRKHGNYLTPGRGLDLVAGMVAVGRTVLASLIGWGLLIHALVMSLIITSYLLWNGLGGNSFWQWVIQGNCRMVQWSQLTVSACQDTLEMTGGDGNAFQQSVWLAYAFPEMTLVFSLFMFLFLLLTVTSPLSAVLYSLATYFISGYRFRRRLEIAGSWMGKLWAVSLLVGALPILANWVGYHGGWGTLAGLAMSWRSMASVQKGGKGLVSPALKASLASLLVLYGFMVMATYWMMESFYRRYSDDAVEFILLILGAALLVNLVVNINKLSPHRFYRDRLMEAFLPDPGRILEDVPLAPQADKGRIQQVWNAQAPRSPFHLVNTNAVLVDSPRRVLRMRGGDSFVLSPGYCGSRATGWQSAEAFMGGDVHLSTAMAISGAAANPNAGVAGQGVTRNRAVSLLMTMLNISLGYWVPNPAKLGFRQNPNRLFPGLSPVSGGLEETNAFIQLSDGGHFENLAVYELIRRRARLVVCCDAGADPEYMFEDLQNLVRRLEEDFGVWLEFDADNHLERVTPTQAADFPPDTKRAERGHVAGVIHYPEGVEGVFVLLKPTMVSNLSLKTKGYKGANPDFPDQSTADQFFDQAQFEAYRELGYRLAQQMISGVSLRGKTGLLNLMDGIQPSKAGV
ncbi:MAG: patatin-like phospholipase family protein [Deltaproteobacteria bacterium]|nr:patatin-like phospholipase family protein [Deltaproteobacteria bacterium]